METFFDLLLTAEVCSIGNGGGGAGGGDGESEAGFILEAHELSYGWRRCVGPKIEELRPEDDEYENKDSASESDAPPFIVSLWGSFGRRPLWAMFCVVEKRPEDDPEDAQSSHPEEELGVCMVHILQFSP